jgi:hypothetical protein
LKSFILPASSKNKFRISSLCALMFGTVIGGGAAEPESEPVPRGPIGLTLKSRSPLLSLSDRSTEGATSVSTRVPGVPSVPYSLFGGRGGVPVGVPDIVIHNPETFSENGS